MSLKKGRFSHFKRSIFSFVLILLLGVAACCLTPPNFAQADNGFSLAPINPEFSEYLQNLKMGKVQQQTVDRHQLGYIPSPLDLSYLKEKTASQQAGTFPTTYDLRTLGKLTPVKDQGDCGSYWTFAAYGSLESYLLPSATWDFSENNLKNTHGFDWGHSAGGNRDMATAYLARWSGPISEADDPYNPDSGISPTGLSPKKHVQNVYFIPARGGALDNNNIKQAIMDYGAIYTTFYWNSSYYNSSNYAYYFNSSGSSSNHAVAIVGWDDNFDKNKFHTPAPGNGAFIIRNSWGTSWGQNGYFYVSYYDTNLGYDENTAFNNAEPATNYKTIYQYDPYGWTSSLGVTDSNTCWGANIFTASKSDLLTAVSLYTASPNSTYELKIYTNVNDSTGPTAGTLAGSKTGTIALPGYNTVKLDTPVQLTSGQKFSVVLKLTTPGWGYPIALERRYSGYDSNATSNPKESWYSIKGSSWYDTYSNGFGNVCIKAFTSSNASITVTSPNGSESWMAGGTYTIKWNYSGSPGSNVKIDLYKGGAFNRTIVASTPVGTGGIGSYSWLIPPGQAAGSDYKVRITSTADSTITDYSNNYFRIRPRPPLLVNSPNGGENWMAGGTYDIKWSYTGSPGSYVKLDLYKGTAFNRTIVASTPVGAGGTGSYSWLIPAGQAAGSDYKVRITSTTNSTVTDDSNLYFRIRPRPPLLVTSPNGGENWMAGGTYTIKWSYTGNPGSYVKLDMYKGTAFNRTIVASTPVGTGGAGSYSWTIPSTLVSGSDYKVKITSTTSSAINDYSNLYFRIRPKLTVHQLELSKPLQPWRLQLD